MERNWEGTIPVYINNYNQLTTTRKTAQYFDDVPGTKVIVLDNNSTYPPLLQWYQECKYTIVLLKKNCGCYGPWNAGILPNPAKHREKYESEYYVVTDADLDITDCPKDLLSVLIDGKLNHPHAAKAGLSIRIDDLPEGCPSKQYAYSWESQYWGKKTGYKTSNGVEFYEAFVDTTFAVYSVGRDRPYTIHPAIRSNMPYSARHWPWYITSENLDEEYRFIINSYPKKSTVHNQDWINYLRVLL